MPQCNSIKEKIDAIMRKYRIYSYSIEYERVSDILILTMDLPQEFFVSDKYGYTKLGKLISDELELFDEFDSFGVLQDYDDEELNGYTTVIVYFDCAMEIEPT